MTQLLLNEFLTDKAGMSGSGSGRSVWQLQQVTQEDPWPEKQLHRIFSFFSFLFFYLVILSSENRLPENFTLRFNVTFSF